MSSLASPLVARAIARVMQTRRQLEGGGFPVRRPPLDNIGGLILLFDHMGPMILPPGKEFPAPDHPHRGFSTISMHLQGTLEHFCSSGHKGVMGPGAVQWMEAGRGVVHGGNVPKELLPKGQTVEAFQIWINLPRSLKMIPPRYQEITAESLPIVSIPHPKGPDFPVSTMKIIAGEYKGTRAVIETRVQISFFDIRLQPGASVTLEVPRGQVGLAYTYRGSGQFGSGGDVLSEGVFGTLGEDGDTLTITAPEEAPLVEVPAPHRDVTAGSERAALAALVIFGEPINEPIARRGPFVMNTDEEIQQAFSDFRSGKMGRESRVKHDYDL